MKNSLWVLLYLLLLLLIVFFEYKKSENKLLNGSVYDYKIEENRALEELFLSYTDNLNIDFDLDGQWGIAKREKEVKESERTEQVHVRVKEKTLCIEQECFRLLGLFQKEQHHYASFYNKNSKEKVKEFLVGEIINRSIKIKTIMKKSVIFEDINSTREWHMRLFDVNSSKYKPKDFES